MLKNDLYIRALKGEKMNRPPVWIMRQAGRYLPEFIKLKKKYNFFTCCETPELAAKITMMPINRFPLDAAILFSDILVVPNAMGIKFKLNKSIGPYLENPINSIEKINSIKIPDVTISLSYVYQAIDYTLEMLKNNIPLIGFAGSPWTILCYIIEGKSSKIFDKVKKFCFTNPETAHLLLKKITKTTTLYLKKKIKHGVHAIQLFDSLGGILSPIDYKNFSWKYLNEIIEHLSQEVPIIVFGKGCYFSLEEMSKSKLSAIGIDWTVSNNFARTKTKNNITLQGNLDPSKLLAPKKIIKQETLKMIKSFGTEKYIAGLGNGILPNTPLENAETFIETIVKYNKNT